MDPFGNLLDLQKKKRILRGQGRMGQAWFQGFFLFLWKRKRKTNLIQYHLPTKRGMSGILKQLAVAFFPIWRGRFCRRCVCRHHREVRCRRTGFRIEWIWHIYIYICIHNIVRGGLFFWGIVSVFFWISVSLLLCFLLFPTFPYFSCFSAFLLLCFSLCFCFSYCR